MGRFTDDDKQRFDSKWKKVGNCLLWQGPLDKDGYGTFFFKKRNRRAHRVSYYFNMGDIPSGMVVDHMCGKRNCVEPSHLRAITPRENILDGRGVGAINAKKTHCKRGHLFDKFYSGQRCCSICENAKKKRLAKKWAAEDTVMC